MHRVVASRRMCACCVGQVVAAREITEGLVLRQETVPLGVLMVIFESRPDALPQVCDGLRVSSGAA